MPDSNVVGALLYLRITSLRNLLLSRLRRLKQPKYLIGAVIGIGYFWLVFFRPTSRRRGPLSDGPLDTIPDALPLVSIVGAGALLVFVALAWILRRPRAALGFSEAEIAFLFPAPMSRTALINYRLISLGLTTTFTALILALVSGGLPFVAGNFAMRFTGWWLIFSTLSLHIIGSSFAITRWMDRGASSLRIQATAFGVIALLVGLPIAWLLHGVPAGEFPAVAALQTGPVAWLLWPFKLVLGPLLAADGFAFLLALAPALIIYAAHYLWVLHSQVGFEEASIAKAAKREAALAAVRAGNWRLAGGKHKARRAPFDLARAWRPELAFLWKNLLSSASYLRLRNALIAAVVIVFACTWFRDAGFYQHLRPILAGVAATIAAYVVLLGPQLARQDLRHDLPNTDILKTYPLHGWQIMLGEMLTPAAILTVLLWLMLLAAAMLAPSNVPKMEWLTPGIRTAAAIGLALLAPLLCMSQLLVVNAAAVLFPAWQQTGTGQPQQGIEVMGQRILFLVGQVFTMVIMLLPPAFMAVLAFFLSRWMLGNAAAAIIAALLAMTVLAAEIGVGIALLGRRFERLDLSMELRP